MDNDVCVSVPKSVTNEEIEEILAQKQPWIEKTFKEHLKNIRHRKPTSFLAGEKVSFLGDLYTLKWKTDKQPEVYLQGKNLVISLPNNLPSRQKVSMVQKLVYNWYISVADQVIRERLPIYCQKLGVKPNKISIKDMKTRWASCSSLKNLSFCWRIVKAPLQVVDYVIVHELCHIRHLNHSQNFWRLVEKTFPNYQLYKSWLGKNEASFAP